MNVDEMVRGVHDALSVQRVYGDAVERDDVTVIPVAVVRGAGGGGGDDSNNGGGGFAVRARPVGVFVLRDGGAVQWKPAVDVQRLAFGALAAIVVVAAFSRRRSSAVGA